MSQREYNIDMNNPEAAARTTIGMHRDTLIELRHRTDKRDELEWEIRLYEYMLVDPVKRLKEYNKVRHHGDNLGRKPPMDKRQVVKILGWVVP